MPLKRLALLFALFALLFSACAPKTQDAQSGALQNESAAPVPNTPVPAAGNRQPPRRIGFIIDDNASVENALLMHGFLRMAENMGYPAKLYRAAAGEASLNALDAAIGDDCKGLLIQNKNGGNDAAVRKALEEGLKVVVPYDACEVEGLQANVAVDESEYIEEIVRSIAMRMMERSLKSGRILLYYQNPAESAVPAFHNAVSRCYSQYTSAEFMRAAADEAGAVAELSDYLLNNRDIKGMLVCDGALASIAVQARNDASARFKKDGAPTPSPEAKERTEEPGGTPAPTVAPGLLTQISITIFACGQSDENYALLRANEIYGLCIEPYYDVAARAAMTLDQLLAGDLVSGKARANRPIVTANTLDKYTLIYRQARELFGLEPQEEA